MERYHKRGNRLFKYMLYSKHSSNNHQRDNELDRPDELRSFIKKYLNEAPTILKPTTEYMIKNYAFSKSEK